MPPTAGGMTVVTVGPMPSEGMAAIAAAGAQVANTLGWGALDDAAFHGNPPPIVIAAVPGDIGHGPLERLRAILDEGTLEAVVVFEADALDAVAAVLMAPRVELLCEAGPGEWAAALAVAALRGEAAPARVREGDDGERLRRLNAEVARIAALLAGLVEPGAGDVAAPGPRYAAGLDGDVAIDPGEIRRVIRARRLRGQFFPARLLEDPAWDMLLDLFAAELERAQVSVSSLCIASGVPPTTALRWISHMAEAGLMVRIADAGDKRRAFLALSGRASDGMRGYVAAVKRAGLPVA